ncbi:hypothetical protein [Shewanella algae]|uniref:hypothetical protein n=1 Tax=Shewanella algae TaxID=38313 RepID=UPI0031F5BF0F
MSGFFSKLVLKVNFKYIVSLLLVASKTTAGFIFSWLLIDIYGEQIHVQILKDLSAVIGISLIIRFGADAVVLKLATKFYIDRDAKYLLLLLFSSLTLCFLNSLVFFYLFNSYFYFETIGNSDYIYIAFSISLTFCMMSFLKAFKRVNFSFLGDAGIVMIFTFPLLLIRDINVLVTMGYIWCSIASLSILFIIRVIFKECDIKRDERDCSFVSSFFIPLPNLFLNSSLNYLQQWGIIYLAALSLDVKYASSFILIIRASYIFNAVLSPLASYTVPEVIRLYEQGGAQRVNEYVKRTGWLYRYASVFCLLISSVFSIWSVYPTLLELNYVLTFLFFLFCCSFNIMSGPVNMYMAMLGFDWVLIRIRIAISIPFFLVVFNVVDNMFIITCSFYILLQRIVLVYFLKKKSGIIAV